jgi:hypothetical protein
VTGAIVINMTMGTQRPSPCFIVDNSTFGVGHFIWGFLYGTFYPSGYEIVIKSMEPNKRFSLQ